MNDDPCRELRELLQEGWKVLNFTGIVEQTNGTPGNSEEPTVIETGGYAILLERAGELAVCDVRYDGTSEPREYLAVQRVYFLTK